MNANSSDRSSQPASPQSEAPAKGKCKTDCGSDYCLVQCQNEAAAQPASSSAPAVGGGELAIIEKAAIRVGMKSLLNHGAASCVYSEGCEGVTQEHLVAFTREIALHCAAALAAQGDGSGA